MRLVDESIEDRVGQSGIGHGFVPVLEGQLTGDERGGLAVAVFEHLEQVSALTVLGRSEAEVVDDEQGGTGEPLEHAGVGAVAACDDQIAEQAREPEVTCGEPQSAGAVTECTGRENSSPYRLRR